VGTRRAKKSPGVDSSSNQSESGNQSHSGPRSHIGQLVTRSPASTGQRSHVGKLVTRSPASTGHRSHVGQLVTRSPASTRSPAHDSGWATPGLGSPRHTAQSPQVSNPYSRQYSTPSRTRETSESSISSNPRKRETSDSDLSPPVSKKSKTCRNTSRNENNLQCPDCDRVFVAKTILERHLYTAKHGVYSLYSSDSGPGSPYQKAKLPKQSINDRAVDCHLCGQKFIRVKDLAKHREKLCTAYKNLGQ